jgi:excisionase family DNA binding protein
MHDKSVTNKEHKDIHRLALSVEDAAWRLSVSPSFLRLEIARGRLRPSRLRRRVLISECEIQRYLSDNSPTDGTNER